MKRNWADQREGNHNPACYVKEKNLFQRKGRKDYSKENVYNDGLMPL